MSAIIKPKFDCKCIDIEFSSELKIALLTARDTYNDISTRLMKIGPENSSAIEELQEKSKIFHKLITEIEKIPPC